VNTKGGIFMLLDEFDNTIPTLEYFIYRDNTPNWSIESAEINFIDLTYVIKGQATYIIDGQRVIVEEGDLICIPKKSMRSAYSDVPSKFECFASNLCMHNLKGEETIIPLPLVSNVGIHSEIISQYRRLNETWLSRHPGYVMRVRAHLMIILQRFLAMLVYDVDTYQFDPRIKQAIRYITDNYAESLNISAVAEAVSLNPVYFGALFKKETHVTFRDYLNTIRLNQAEDMLRTGKWNVTEVAQHCGFTDVFYFSRLFKKHKGIPPSAVESYMRKPLPNMELK